MRALKMCIIIVVFLLLNGCASPQSEATQASASKTPVQSNQSEPDWTKWINAKQDEIAAWTYLPNGGVLALYNTNRFLEEEYGRPIKGDPAYELIQVKSVNDKIKVTDLYIVGPFEENNVTAIFYDEDWNSDRPWKTYLSSFRRLIDSSGDESMVLIVVTPNTVVGQRYQVSDYYQVEPSDSLNSIPLKVCQEDYMLGYPVWFYVIPIEKITEDYELRYGEFVLTGTDILTNSWSIGDAPILPYPGYDHSGDG